MIFVVSTPVVKGMMSWRTLHGHHDLFQRGVARALAQTVDRAFDLPRAARHGGQAVGRRHAEVVVAMGGEDHVLAALAFRDQAADQVGDSTGAV
jgi:hypothetical protein